MRADGIVADEITPEYQREIDKTMRRAEQAWRKAQKQLAATERRLERARLNRSAARDAAELAARRRAVGQLEAQVEARRVELENLHRLMAASAYSSQSRGKKSFRPVPKPGGLL